MGRKAINKLLSHTKKTNTLFMLKATMIRGGKPLETGENQNHESKRFPLHAEMDVLFKLCKYHCPNITIKQFSSSTSIINLFKSIKISTKKNNMELITLLKKCKLVVIRERNVDDQFGNAKPCADCCRVLNFIGIDVIYSNGGDNNMVRESKKNLHNTHVCKRNRF